MSSSLEAGPAGVSRWAPERFSGAEIPLITARDVAPVLPGVDLWDCWPLADVWGKTVVCHGRSYWFFLSAPCFPDPVQRHDVARIRLLSYGADGWRDHGNAWPDGFSPGSREWAGSALLHENGRDVTLFFTAAGRRGEGATSEQRLFAARGGLGGEGPGDWEGLHELVAPDGLRYQAPHRGVGRPGAIKAFRDPAWFRDPVTHQDHLLFTGSAAWSRHEFNGLIGLCTREPSGWVLETPLLEATGVNNELERPHILYRNGRYYLFWSTQRHTFAPDVAPGPTGLYAAVAEHLRGPWKSVNEGGLVARNPVSEPTQSYSWWVTGEGEAWSFIDHWGLQGRSLQEHPELLRSHFGGTPAPPFQLAFEGDRVVLVS